MFLFIIILQISLLFHIYFNLFEIIQICLIIHTITDPDSAITKADCIPAFFLQKAGKSFLHSCTLLKAPALPPPDLKACFAASDLHSFLKTRRLALRLNPDICFKSLKAESLNLLPLHPFLYKTGTDADRGIRIFKMKIPPDAPSFLYLYLFLSPARFSFFFKNIQITDIGFFHDTLPYSSDSSSACCSATSSVCT